MNEKEKQKLLEKYGEAMTLISGIKNPIIASQKHIQAMSDLFEDIWQEGYNTGFQVGKEAWEKLKSN